MLDKRRWSSSARGNFYKTTRSRLRALHTASRVRDRMCSIHSGQEARRQRDVLARPHRHADSLRDLRSAVAGLSAAECVASLITSHAIYSRFQPLIHLDRLWVIPAASVIDLDQGFVSRIIQITRPQPRATRSR